MRPQDGACAPGSAPALSSGRATLSPSPASSSSPGRAWPTPTPAGALLMLGGRARSALGGPSLAAAGGVLLLGETFSPRLLVAGLLILGGIALAALRHRP